MLITSRKKLGRSQLTNNQKGTIGFLATSVATILLTVGVLSHIADRKLEEMEQESEELNDNIEENESDITDLNQKLNDEKKMVEETEKEYSELQKDHKKVKKSLKKHKKEKDKLEDDLKESESKLQTLSSEKPKEKSKKTASKNSGESKGDNTKAEGSTFNTTHYTAFCDGCSGITSTGEDVRNTIYHSNGMRIVAVDPTVIPLESVVKVTYPNGDTFQAVAADVGSDIKGNRLDILVGSKSEAYKLGRQNVTVEVVK